MHKNFAGTSPFAGGFAIDSAPAVGDVPAIAGVSAMGGVPLIGGISAICGVFFIGGVSDAARFCTSSSSFIYSHNMIFYIWA